ncbi:polyprenyl synthetase family protein [Aliidongia sp.]|uniref:polyprenyl synthetase family protein n=1 Tax=Aliidongia sp. TaxID=1914230 RepID=UPI0039C8A7ED
MPGLTNTAEAARKPDMSALSALVDSDLKRVNALILDRMQSPVALIPQLAGHIIAAGGKRLRPMLTLASAKLVGYRGDRHLALSAAVEFIHTATLLHDDVVDASDLRRGLATANAVWGNKPSVLVGDFLFSRAFQLMVEDGSLDVLRILSGASAVIAEGEVLQLVTANDIETTEEAYLQVIGAKTAVLFAAASEIGAVVAGRPEEEIKALARFGQSLGMAFQLIDDMLDFSAREAELGKSVGDDFRDGKMTLPIVLALKAADDTERAFWRRTLEEQEQTDADLGHAIGLLRKHGTLDATMERARFYAEDAAAALMLFPDQPIRRALLDVIEFCLQRGY